MSTIEPPKPLPFAVALLSAALVACAAESEEDARVTEGAASASPADGAGASSDVTELTSIASLFGVTCPRPRLATFRTSRVVDCDETISVIGKYERAHVRQDEVAWRFAVETVTHRSSPGVELPGDILRTAIGLDLARYEMVIPSQTGATMVFANPTGDATRPVVFELGREPGAAYSVEWWAAPTTPQPRIDAVKVTLRHDVAVAASRFRLGSLQAAGNVSPPDDPYAEVWTYQFANGAVTYNTQGGVVSLSYADHFMNFADTFNYAFLNGVAPSPMREGEIGFYTGTKPDGSASYFNRGRCEQGDCLPVDE